MYIVNTYIKIKLHIRKVEHCNVHTLLLSMSTEVPKMLFLEQFYVGSFKDDI